MKNRQDTARRPGATPRAGQPRRLARAALAGGLAVCGLAQAQDAAAPVDPWKVDIYYENDTRFRGNDATGDRVGLSKFRNTLQVEADKKLEGGWKFRSILRGSFDGVYRMNDDQYGRKAGGGGS